MGGKVVKPPPLSGKFEGSFAYITLRDRLPKILTKVIDVTHRKRQEVALISEKSNGMEVVKNVIGLLSDLRSRLLTDKPLTEIKGSRSDVAKWNEALQLQRLSLRNEQPRWYNVAWLFVECYFYRKIFEAFNENLYPNCWDPFAYQKSQTLNDNLSTIRSLCSYFLSELQKLVLNEHMVNHDEKLAVVETLIQLSLWGNECDLSISEGQKSVSSLLLSQLKSRQQMLVVNQLSSFMMWMRAMTDGQPLNRVDIVLDNCGLELVTDLCLADYLIESDMAKVVHFHAKSFPYFVSDVTMPDFTNTLKTLGSHSDEILSNVAEHWKKLLDSKQFVLHTHDFWTLPYPYCEMKKVAAELFEELALSNLVVFKGDLNYRKLLSDLQWPVSTSFEDSLLGFRPSSLLSLRTLKADLICGMDEEEAMHLTAVDKNWMLTGKYGLIQFLS
ncbi:unnamed protein product [Soboliphyme baturini]|uniref:Sugar phosphate phosphatase n=1 Tax=Soboliphyme baturini TaxID=241478 RepID=A0A183IZH1_9BILA|nr:unnamed protein product [Soboliphyme baturini]